MIATNEPYKKIDIERNNVKAKDILVVRNGPDLENSARLVSPSQKFKGSNKLLLGYVGVMNPQDGLDYFLISIKHLVYDLKRDDFKATLIATGDSLTNLKKLVLI